MERLQHLTVLLQLEIDTIETPQCNTMDGNRPHIKATLTRLALLEKVLALVPRKVMLQHAKEPHVSKRPT